jgi:hypothetical protein
MSWILSLKIDWMIADNSPTYSWAFGLQIKEWKTRISTAGTDQDNIKKLIEPTKIVSQLLSFQINPRFSELMWHVRQHPTQLLINQVHLTMFKRKITKKYVQCFTETVNKVWSISENTDYNIFWLGLLYAKNIRIITIKHILLTEGSKGSEHLETHVQSLHSITGIKCVFAISLAWLKVYII